MDGLMISSSSSSSSSSYESRKSMEKPAINIEKAEQCERKSKPILIKPIKLNVTGRQGNTPPPKVDYTEKILIRRRQRTQVSAQDPQELHDLKQFELLSPHPLRK